VRDGVLVCDDDGKPWWQPIVSFMNHGMRSSWSRQIIKVVRVEYPRLLPEPADAE
jgi:hypothetical protein